MEEVFDIGIIGGGPAGYSAAIRASQKGLRTVLFEKDCIGGVCLNRGCIPTKTILHCSDFYKNLKKAEKFGVCLGQEQPKADYEKIYNRKNDVVAKIQKSLLKLVQSHGVNIINAEAKLIGQNLLKAEENIFTFKNIILATGSKSVQIQGLECDGKFIFNSSQILNCNTLPENILVVGSGAIGVEWARIFSGFNKAVTVVELASKLLPQADTDVSKRLERLFKKEKIKYFTQTKIEKIENHDVILSNGQVLKPDMILCAIGREPVLPVCEGIEIEKDGKFVKVNQNFQTNYKNIFAIGDINGKLQLAHSAQHQAIGVVDYIVKGDDVHFDKNLVPSVIYGSPEIAWVGKTEEDLNAEDYKVSTFPVAALGKAQADDEIDGFLKVIEQNGKISGAHAVMPEASSIIQQFALMMTGNIDVKLALKTVFAHPTYSEAVFESLLGLEDGSISLPPV
mgnify:FL=1